MVVRGLVHECLAGSGPRDLPIPVVHPLETLQPHDTPSPSACPRARLRAASPHDTPHLWRLARDSGGLDLNSPYAYALAGHHFAATSVVAETCDGMAGFVYAYPPPSEPDTVFVWQVTVAPEHRGAGLARQLLLEVVARSRALGARRLTASVTPSNEASRRLFRAVAREVGATCTERPWIGSDLFPNEAGDLHEPEHLIVVAPLPTPTTVHDGPEGTP